MKKLLILFISVFWSAMLMAQVNLDIKDKKMTFFTDLEDQNQSKPVKNETVYLNGPAVGQPVIYRRRQSLLADLLVYYYPFKKDSTISYILYEWRDTGGKALPFNELQPYFAKYNELLAAVTAKYGNSTAEGNLSDTSLIEKDELIRTDKWDNDTARVELTLTLSNKNLTEGNTSMTSTHTLRLYVRNPEKSGDFQTLSDEKTRQLDATAKLFLADICAGKFDDSRKYIATAVVAKVTDAQLGTLKDAIKDENWVLDLTGVQVAPTGKTYTNLRYKRPGDTNAPPLEIISIVFDETDKVVGIQPQTKASSQ